MSEGGEGKQRKNISKIVVINLLILGCLVASFYLCYKTFLLMGSSMAEGAVTINFIAFLDENENGIHDPGEPPLQRVDFFEGYNPKDFQNISKVTSDRNGKAEIPRMMNAAQLGDGANKAYTKVPYGYRITTPEWYEITDERTFYFGFVPKPGSDAEP